MAVPRQPPVCRPRLLSFLCAECERRVYCHKREREREREIQNAQFTGPAGYTAAWGSASALLPRARWYFRLCRLTYAPQAMGELGTKVGKVV